MLFRWTEWNGADAERVLGDLRRLRSMGIGANLFYPKWGGPNGRPPIQNHQAFLVDEPGDRGWGPMVDFANRARELGCLSQGFIRPCEQSPGVTGYDESFWAVNATVPARTISAPTRRSRSPLRRWTAWRSEASPSTCSTSTGTRRRAFRHAASRLIIR